METVSLFAVSVHQYICCWWINSMKDPACRFHWSITWKTGWEVTTKFFMQQGVIRRLTILIPSESNFADIELQLLTYYKRGRSLPSTLNLGTDVENSIELYLGKKSKWITPVIWLKLDQDVNGGNPIFLSYSGNLLKGRTKIAHL